MTPSSCTANSTSSPSLMCSACLIGSGRVSCAFERSFARALVCGSCSCLAPASFTGDPPLRVTRNVRFSQTYSDHRLRCRDMLVNCPDNLGQQMTVDVFEL